MEPIYNVEREVDTVINNFNEFNKHCSDNLTSLITSVEGLKENFDESCKCHPTTSHWPRPFPGISCKSLLAKEALLQITIT